MYQQLVVINPKDFINQGVRPHSDLHFAAKEMLVEIAFSEVSHALSAFPLVFADGGRGVYMAALLSLMPDTNNFVTPDGRWTAAYMPAILRTYPYAAVPNPANPEDDLICVEQACVIPASDDNPALFSDGGLPGEKMQETIRFFEKYIPARNMTRKASTALQAAGVLSPWELKVEIDGQETLFSGLLQVDEEKLKALPAEKILALCQSGALGLAYAQILSSSRMEALKKVTSSHIHHHKKRSELEKQLEMLTNGGDALSFGF